MNIYQDLPAFPSERKPILPNRVKRLRVAWFILGIISGIILTRAADTTLEFSVEIASEFGSVSNLQELFTDRLEKDSQEHAIIPEAETAKPVVDTSGSVVPRTASFPAMDTLTTITPEYPKQLTLSVKRGDTLLDMLTKAGLGREEAYHIAQALKPAYNPRKLRPSHEFSLEVNKTAEGDLTAQGLTITVSPTEKVVLTREKNGKFQTKKEAVPLVKETARAGGAITSSLYQTAMDAGMPDNLVAELINAYSYDVDFQRDIKSGDAIEVLFEQLQTKSGDVIGGNNVLHAILTLGGKKIAIYRYTDGKGNSGYYNAKGESVRKALLKTPVNGARISSRYGKRRHPVLGYTKMHKGVDFAASRGTPIYAAGDGVVERANRYGGYGNYVRIRHNGKYATAYAHMRRFGKNIRRGKRVKQGQVIGYVGTTGRSTGPHLHYEILAYGKQVNPSGVKFKTGRTLKGKELARFKTRAQELGSLIASLPRLKTDVAAIIN